ncbi:tRNA pseudouridine(38-40) synthase TruA [Arthrobacter sp. MYb213]|uniref:tRNA pseudouridine(38-40) synthase TruA n=1 Tax=Arthrobacter sp. MYb213 TaxID=1848595 RepID=UPI000CFB23C0|nr:tRNA pseudouridine(38-40) synthase TruA [Arthrobacter sp. MYb213]PRB71369.1 tRNA pseudouridine(38-40) synthase TruA [Arthrobacter sp. MYb213]
MSSQSDNFDPLGTTALGTTDKPALIRMRMVLGYDGAAYNGWARQPNVTGVQQLVEEALETLIRRLVRVFVAGRTDAGVHARHQVVHFDLTEEEYLGLPRNSDLEPGPALLRRINGLLGQQQGAVWVHEVDRAADGFDARFSALARRYSYRIADGIHRWDPLSRQLTMWYREEIDIDLLNAEAQSVLGRHDFLSFCKPKPRATTIRTLQEFVFSRAEDGNIVVHLKADAFCHNMVRSLIGGALRVASGREQPGFLAERLALMVRDSKSILAHPHPLVLEEVYYPDDDELAARAALTRARRDVSQTDSLKSLD